MVVPTVGPGLDRGLGVPGEMFGHHADLRINRLVPLDHFAGIGGHTSEDRRHGAVSAVFGLVVGLVVADRIEEVVVFLLIGVFSLSLESPGDLPFHVTRRVFTAATAHVAEAFRSGHMLGNIAPTTVDMAAAAEAAGAVRVFKFDGVVIED